MNIDYFSNQKTIKGYFIIINIERLLGQICIVKNFKGIIKISAQFTFIIKIL